eukprot:524731_1
MLLNAHEFNVIVELVDTDPGSVPSPPTLMLLGKDGVYVSDAPRPLDSNVFFFSISSRVDVLVYAPPGSAGEHRYELLANNAGDDVFKHHLGYINVVASNNPPQTIDLFLPSFDICRPYYLMDLFDEVANGPITTVEIRGDINGELISEDLTHLFDMEYDTVQQWRIAGTEAHPTHLHVQHFQLQDDSPQVPNVPGWHVRGDWIDTVSILGQADIKFRTERFGGNYFLHCHVLEHADGGVMAVIGVEDGNPYGLLPSAAFANYGSCGAKAVMTVGTIPGEVSATSWDIGEEGVAYFDSTPNNEGLAGGRYLDAVDVSALSEFEGLEAVTHITDGEWLRYTVAVEQAGLYTSSLRLMTDSEGAAYITLHVSPGACFAEAPSDCSETQVGEQFNVEYIPDTWQTVTSPSTIFIDEEVACL